MVLSHWGGRILGAGARLISGLRAMAPETEFVMHTSQADKALTLAQGHAGVTDAHVDGTVQKPRLVLEQIVRAASSEVRIMSSSARRSRGMKARISRMNH